MRYRYLICDVFTTNRFGGNQLAVLPEADGLATGQMQQIAREFNFSESAFVFPSDEHTRKVRIFTPSVEVPFAGHPNIGTAFVLATEGALGDIGDIGDGVSVSFDEAAGPVVITVNRDRTGHIRCELAAPQPLTLGGVADPSQVSRALSLDVDDVRTDTHLPQVAGVGLPFLVVELRSRDALQRARADGAALERLRDAGLVPDIHCYVRSDDEFDVRARMFAPLDGVPEDPATGSANCALAALLVHFGDGNDAAGRWRIAQGVEMGRPSVLEARAQRVAGTIRSWIGGHSVLVSDGQLYVD